MAKRIKQTLTYKDYEAMSYHELHRTLKGMLGQAQRLTIWYGAVEKLDLLPALQAMHDKVAQPGRRIADPDKPNWEDVCRTLGLTPDVVRMWRMRTAAHTDIRHLVGEQRPKPKLSQEQLNRQAVKHLAMLCRVVLNGEEEGAEVLALTLAERYGF